MEKCQKVGHLSSHSVIEWMRKSRARKSEVKWNESPKRGSRTQDSVETAVDGRFRDHELGGDVQSGYLKELSVPNDGYIISSCSSGSRNRISRVKGGHR